MVYIGMIGFWGDVVLGVLVPYVGFQTRYLFFSFDRKEEV